MGCLGPRAPTTRKKGGRKEDAARKAPTDQMEEKEKDRKRKKESGMGMPALMAPTTPIMEKEERKGRK